MADEYWAMEIKGLPELMKKLSLITDPFFVALDDLTNFAEQETRAGAKPHAGDLGTLSRGQMIRHELSAPGTPLSQLHAKVYTRSPIVIAADQGRDPGGRMPPVGALARWAPRHGINERRAFFLARAIGRRGSKPIEFFRKALEKTAHEADAVLRETARKIERDWSK
jgi:hypothetical protein